MQINFKIVYDREIYEFSDKEMIAIVRLALDKLSPPVVVGHLLAEGFEITGTTDGPEEIE